VRFSRVFSTTTVGLAVVLGLAACGSSGGGTAKTQPSPTTSNHGMSTQEMLCMDQHYAGHNPQKCGGAANGAAYTLTHPLKVDANGLVDPASINLSGVKGVTPTQQQEATDLLANTIKDLPQWSDIEKAKADGFQSIGDGLTGEEHLLHWDWIDDNTVFDPNHPESLVYKVDRATGTRTLEAAMYILPKQYTLENPHPISSPLVQFHYHDNLCFTAATPMAGPQVRGLTDAQGNCPAGLTKFNPNIQVHVWIRPNDCGPFAALLGVGAGQIAPGATRSCVHDHTKLTL
jgi:hypothetical protein